jgi:diguanylate cyclase (GGDEF)-like protein
MKRILLKSTIATFLSIAASLLVVVTVVPALGGVVDGNAWLMSVVCPLLVAWPASAHTFWQNDRLRRARDELAAAHRDLAEAHRQLTEKARRDDMTGLLNREAFLAKLAESGKGVGGVLLIIDADHFKAVNDRFGHSAGDRALLKIAAAIGRGVRTGDIVGRIGGEEFAVLLPGVGTEEAQQIAERVRLEVEQIRFQPQHSLRLPLTVSIGGAELAAGRSVSEHMRVADERLYAAKQSGRNRVVFGPGVRAAA